jgi:hypothetical protein
MVETSSAKNKSIVIVIDVEEGENSFYKTAKDKDEIEAAIEGETIDPIDPITDPDELSKKIESSLNEVEPISIFGGKSNPSKCRYVKVGGTWRKVCR